MLPINSLNYGNTFELINAVDDNSIDLIICDGPYGVTNESWDRIDCIQLFNYDIIQKCTPKLKDGGSLYLFGKADCIDFIPYFKYLTLQSKIIWYQPSRLAQGRINYTNNYDLICYFTKGTRPKTFNLNDIRVPQLTELTQRNRVEKVPSVRSGNYSKTKYNDLGKNPGNVWGDIKQLTYKSKELIDRTLLNTIQKPEKLIERMVLASSNPNDLVLDLFMGVGTVPVVCKKNNRNFIAFEMNQDYIDISRKRLDGL